MRPDELKSGHLYEDETGKWRRKLLAIRGDQVAYRDGPSVRMQVMSRADFARWAARDVTRQPAVRLASTPGRWASR